MKLQERTTTYRRYPSSAQQRETKGIQQTIVTQSLICLLVLIFCILIKLYPDESLAKIRNSISLIVSHNTKVEDVTARIKAYFQKDETLETLNPVSTLVAPSSGAIIKGFGMQNAEQSDFHYGIDIAAEKAESIVAANDGEVTEIATNAEYGSYIIIRHSEEISTLYGQLDEILTEVGAKVSREQPIARAGGNQNFFYFELRRGDTYLNPAEFISFKEQEND